MWPFSKKKPKKAKRRKHLDIPLWSNEGMCAYPIRTAPKSFRGKRLPKRLARVDGIHEFPEDLTMEVAPLHGGGDYVCRLHLEANKKIYFGTYKFSLPWEPLIDGQEIEPKEER